MPPAPSVRPELLAALRDGVAGLARSEQWRRHLEAQSRFPRYSFGNVLLIVHQRPDATRVAGFAAWRALGRSVRRGERAIYIRAPVVRRRPGPETARAEGPDPAPAVAFRFVPVFDLAQTEGPPLPEPCTPLTGDDVPDRFGRLVGVARDLGYRVEAGALGGPHGDCCPARRRIRVEAADRPDQQVKTLAHELGHALLHAAADDRARAELEAESVAFVVCRSLGLDTGGYSFGYVTHWAGGSEAALAGLRASGERIQRAAADILARASAGDPVAA